MSRLVMSSPLTLKPESTKEVSDSFKSLKKTLKDTLERLETIGINDIEPPDELVSLKAQIAQKDKLINEQSQIIEKLTSQVSILANSSRANSEVPTELSRLISGCLFKLQDFPEFAETLNMNQGELVNLLKIKKHDVVLTSVLNTFCEFMEYCKIKPQGVRGGMDSFEMRGAGVNKSSSRISKYSDLDQEINDQKRVFSSLFKEIAQSLNPDMNDDLGSEIDES